MNHEDYKELLSLQALSTLGEEEARTLQAHLAACVECRAELDDWQATVGDLAHTAAPLEPSPRVRERILASVSAEAGGVRADNVIPISRAAPRAQQPRPRSWGFQAIAAAVIFVALIVGLVVLWRQNQAAKAQVARLSEQVEVIGRQLEQERHLAEMLTRPGMKMMELSGTKEAPAAHGMLAVDSKSGRAVFMARGLPQAPDGKAYQLWFIAGKLPPMPGGVFKTDAAGNAMVDEQLSAAALTAGTFAVTLEPQDGVSAPTGPMYLLSHS